MNVSEDIIMWLVGGSGALALSLLGGIWVELRSLRVDLSAMASHQASHGIRLDTIENVIEKLPCYREFKCPHERAE